MSYRRSLVLLVKCYLLCVIQFEKLHASLGLHYDTFNGPCFYEQRDDGKLLKIEGVKVSSKSKMFANKFFTALLYTGVGSPMAD